ncbi:P-loop containing nucleoside triphosphate hydrolase protein [Backusella circina FSU 941]|nr:P-loop containing nucleoside triphosphate hydrolase protein [Backusella circina FSU 941]
MTITTTGAEKRKASFMTLDDDEEDAVDSYLKFSSSSNDIVPLDAYQNNNTTMTLEEDDLDALISESIEHEAVVSMDKFFADKQQKRLLPQDNDDDDELDAMIADSIAFENSKHSLLQDDPFSSERLEYPGGSPSRSFLTAMDDMELDDHDDNLFNDLEAAHRSNMTTNTNIDPYFVNSEASTSARLLPPTSTKPASSSSPSSSISKRKNPIVQKKKDYTQMPTTGAFVSAMTSTGQSLYFPKKLKTIKPSQASEYLREIAAKKSTGQLLDKPIWQMQKELAASNKATLERIQREKEQAEDTKKKSRKRRKHDTSGTLWVDKYRPTSFLELMGDQRLNREVLKWVKQWDFCVFKKEVPRESQRDKSLKQYRETFHKDPPGKQQQQQHYKSDAQEDPYLRPDKKILLLSGPPGFGKTTLAHIIAKHAGYNVMELNASDDRTGEAVRSKIKAALEMQAIMREPVSGSGKRIMSMDQKPNILIIDEIDGASSSGGAESFIKQLVDLATADVSTEKSKTKKGKSKRKPLLRPIICICNDLYTPVLRPLRQVAKSVQFKKVPTISIARRLLEICEMEGLESDLRTLSNICESADGDIRSCLNTLQFVRNKSTVLTKEVLEETGLGQKDMGKSLFTVWEEIFNKPNARHKTSLSRDDFDDQKKYMKRLIQSINVNGELERIIQGCFEAYPRMRFHDIALQKFVDISEWLRFYDVTNGRINEKQEYELYRYLPYSIANFHRFFAGTTSQDHRVEYPRVDYEAYAAKKSYENLMNIFLEGVHPSKRRFLSDVDVVTELIPLLMGIISPDLRPVSQQLIKPQEKEALKRVVDTMITYGLSFIQERTEDGQFTYKLEPPVEQFLVFESLPQRSLLSKQYAVRQLISREIELEIIRRREEVLESNRPKSEILPRSKPDIIMKDKPIQEKIPTDFFGRPIASKSASENTAENNTSTLKKVAMEVDLQKPEVIYRYHEGFSNAVKKPMTVQMFL